MSFSNRIYSSNVVLSTADICAMSPRNQSNQSSCKNYRDSFHEKLSYSPYTRYCSYQSCVIFRGASTLISHRNTCIYNLYKQGSFLFPFFGIKIFMLRQTSGAARSMKYIVFLWTATSLTFIIQATFMTRYIKTYLIRAHWKPSHLPQQQMISLRKTLSSTQILERFTQ